MHLSMKINTPLRPLLLACLLLVAHAVSAQSPPEPAGMGAAAEAPRTTERPAAVEERVPGSKGHVGSRAGEKKSLGSFFRKMKKKVKDIRPGSDSRVIGWVFLGVGLGLLLLSLAPVFIGKPVIGLGVIVGGLLLVAGIIGVAVG